MGAEIYELDKTEKLELKDLRSVTPIQARSKREWLAGALRLANIGCMRRDGLSKQEMAALADAITKGM